MTPKTPAGRGKLEEMVAVAERLAQEPDFVRVDLYELGDRIGEAAPSLGLERQSARG